jgi:hypothetical protein
MSKVWTKLMDKIPFIMAWKQKQQQQQQQQQQQTYEKIKNRTKLLLLLLLLYSKTCLKRNLKGPEHFSAEDRFPFNHVILWQSRDREIFPFKTKFRLRQVLLYTDIFSAWIIRRCPILNQSWFF